MAAASFRPGKVTCLRYTFALLDWSEFWQVVQGNGPCNAERLAARNKAHDEGQWVREAALAHAAKRTAKSSAA